MWNSALQEKFNFYFQEFFADVNKIFILVEHWALGYHSMEFRGFSDIS